MLTTPPKIQTDHLARQAYVYIRQSTMTQVVEHQESTRRQYELRQRARQLGWSDEQIVLSLTRIWVFQRLMPTTSAPALSACWPRWSLDKPGLFLAWKSLGWPGRIAKGIAWWKWPL